MADTPDLGSGPQGWGFKSPLAHHSHSLFHIPNSLLEKNPTPPYIIKISP